MDTTGFRSVTLKHNLLTINIMAILMVKYDMVGLDEYAPTGGPLDG